VLCSFSIYFILIIGPHAAFFVWESLGQRFHEFGRNPAWAFAELGVVLVLQAIALGAFYWCWRRRSALRLIVLAVCAAAAFIEAQSLFFSRLPAIFMIEPETAPEKAGEWPEVCRVTDGQLMTVPTPRRLPKDGWDEAWLQDSHGRYSRTAHAGLPADVGAPAATGGPPGRRCGFHDRSDTSGSRAFGAGRASRDRRQQGHVDVGQRRCWDAGARACAGRRERVLGLAPFGPNTYKVVDLDGRSGGALLWVSHPLPGHLLSLGPDGKERPSPVIPPRIKPQSHTIILVEHGVVAWDAYQGDENYTISWALDTGTGSHQVPKGSSPTAVAVDPAGRYIAISTTTSLNIGNTKDTVVVLRTSDGQLISAERGLMLL
jgi:hypothetical protein